MGDFWDQAHCTYAIAQIDGAWECGYLVVEYFSQYLDKCGDKEHCYGVEMSIETCCHHILTTISNMFQHCILLPHGSVFGTKYNVSI
jgi:hypothetical protein